MGFYFGLFDPSGFAPDQERGEWTEGLVLLHNISDALIALASLAIFLVVVYFLRRRRETPFPGVLWLFAALILAWGVSHLLEIVRFYNQLYALAGVIKGVTAVLAVFAAVACIKLVRRALSLPSLAALEREVQGRLQAEDALGRQAQQRRLQTRLLALSNAVVRDLDGRITVWTDGMARLCGWTHAEAVGRVTYELLQTRFAQPLEEIGAQLLRGGRWEGELTHLRADGTEVVVSSVWVLHREGASITVLEVHNDVTALRRAEGESRKVQEAASRPQPTDATNGRKTVLLAEDEDTVRSLIRISLERNGYAVLEAADGMEAFAIADRHPGTINLLVADVMMPRLGGGELGALLAAARPGLKILFVSGYSDEAVARQGVLLDKSHFLRKPFLPATIAEKVREVLTGEG